MNAVMQPQFKLAYFKVAVQHFSHYATGIPHNTHLIYSPVEAKELVRFSLVWFGLDYLLFINFLHWWIIFLLKIKNLQIEILRFYKCFLDQNC